MVTQATNLNLPSKREYLLRIHARCQRTGRVFKSRILDEVWPRPSPARRCARVFRSAAARPTLQRRAMSRPAPWPAAVTPPPVTSLYSLTFTDLYSGWTENRAVWNKGTQASSTS